MTSRRQLASRAAIELIKQFEGYRRTAAKLDDGRWTIGYGHLRTAREGAEVTEADAEALLIYDLMEIADAVHGWIFTPLTQNQFDALVAFVFNIGLDNFRRSSVLRRLNEGDLLQAACAMELWRRADIEGERIVVDALVRRRAAEKALFLTPPEGFVATPSAVLKPKVDHDTVGSVPTERPVDIRASLEGPLARAERREPLAEAEPVAAPALSLEEQAQAVEELAQALAEEPSEALLDEIPEAAPAEPGPSTQDLAEPAESDAAAPETGEFALTSPPAVLPCKGPCPGTEEPQATPVDPAQQALFETEPAYHIPEPAGVQEAPVESPRERRVRRAPGARASNAVPGLLILALAGIALFIAGIVWVFNAKAVSASGGMASSPIGWVLGVAGIACVATAVYFLSERLGGREEP